MTGCGICTRSQIHDDQGQDRNSATQTSLSDPIHQRNATGRRQSGESNDEDARLGEEAASEGNREGRTGKGGTLGGEICRGQRHGAGHLEVGTGGLGVLEVKNRPARMGRNPATGAAIQIQASKKIAFRAAKEFKDAIRGLGATGRSRGRYRKPHAPGRVANRPVPSIVITGSSCWFKQTKRRLAAPISGRLRDGLTSSVSSSSVSRSPG